MILHDPDDPLCKCDDCQVERLMTGRPRGVRPKRSLAELYRKAREQGIVKAISTYK